MWLFDIVFFRSTWSLQVIVHFNILFLFVAEIYSGYECTYWRILCFQYFTLINEGTVSNFVHVFCGPRFSFFSFLYSMCPGVPLLDHMVNIQFVSETARLFPKGTLLFYVLYISPHPDHCVLLSLFVFYLVILSGIEWYLIVLLICISLMDKMLNTFMFLPVISLSSLVHCLCLLFVFNWIS